MTREKQTSAGPNFDALTLILYVTAILTVFALGFTKSTLDQRQHKEAAPNPVVLEFLDKYVAERATHEQERLMEEYFSCVDTSTIDHYGVSSDLRNFNAVFIPQEGTYTGYRVCKSAQGYLEIMLVDDEGIDLPCRIGMCYRVDGDGKIASYTLFRLQPLSENDSEWNVGWL